MFNDLIIKKRKTPCEWLLYAVNGKDEFVFGIHFAKEPTIKDFKKFEKALKTLAISLKEV